MNLQDEGTGFPITQAVLDGTQQGKIFESGASRFVLHKSGFGSILNESVCHYNDFFNLISDDEIPQYFHLYNASPGLINACNMQGGKMNIRIRERVVLRYLGKEPLVVNLPKGFNTIPKMDFPVESFSGFGLNLESKFWNSKIDFLDHAMPVGLLDESGQPAAVCYSAANSSGFAEIDIYTAESHRKKGLGKLVTSLFIIECLQNDYTPNWDCFVENKGSFNLAISMGFTPVLDYNFLSIFK